ncbi:MAG TPA: hypothetical protein VF809_01535, partial [Candidatus Saccharimonadales bacterium]
MNSKHCYLFALEVQPLEVGAVYDELPLHCTLMHRFLSELSTEVLVGRVQSFFNGVAPVKLMPYEHLLLGPKQLPVEVGTEYATKAIYLIEVEVPGYPNQRLIRHKFELSA